MAAMAYGLWPRFAISPRRPRGPPPPPDRVVPSLVATRLAASSSPLVSVLHLRLLAPLAFPSVLKKLSPPSATTAAAASAPPPRARPVVAPSLQSDLAEFLYQQHCNFLRYRKAIAVFHSLNCRPAKSRPVKAESVASDVTSGFDK